MRRIIVALLVAVSQVAVARPCPPFGSQNPVVGTSSTWTGEIAGRSVMCDLCAYVVDIGNFAGGGVEGRCQIKHFGHRRFLVVTFTEEGSQGTLCRRASSARRTCCALAVPSVLFDATHPPVSLNGAFACPHQSGMFALSSGTTP